MTMEKAIERANKVLDTHNHKLIPNWVLKKCKGVALITYSEFGFAFSGGTGDGIIVKHNDDGSWGAPAAICVNLIGLGGILGVAVKYILLYPMNDKGLQELLNGDVIHWGAQLGIAAGPVGTEAESGLNVSSAGAAVTYSYIFEKGAFITAGLNGTQITQMKDANNTFYGANVAPVDIVEKQGAVTIPEGKGVEELHQKLADMTN